MKLYEVVYMDVVYMDNMDVYLHVDDPIPV